MGNDPDIFEMIISKSRKPIPAHRHSTVSILRQRQGSLVGDHRATVHCQRAMKMSLILRTVVSDASCYLAGAPPEIQHA